MKLNARKIEGKLNQMASSTVKTNEKTTNLYVVFLGNKKLSIKSELEPDEFKKWFKENYKQYKRSYHRPQ